MNEALAASKTDIEVAPTRNGTVLITLSGSTGLAVSLHISAAEAQALGGSLARVAAKAVEITRGN